MKAVIDCDFGKGFENIMPVDYHKVKTLNIGNIIITFGKTKIIKLKIIEKQLDLISETLILKCEKI